MNASTIKIRKPGSYRLTGVCALGSASKVIRVRGVNAKTRQIFGPGFEEGHYWELPAEKIDEAPAGICREPYQYDLFSDYLAKCSKC